MKNNLNLDTNILKNTGRLFYSSLKLKLKDQVSLLNEIIDESNFIEIKNYLSGLRHLSISIFRGQDLATSLHIIRILYRERAENKLDLDFKLQDIIDSFQIKY